MGLPLKINGIIAKNSWSAAAVGVPGAFAAHADIPILVGIWTNMLWKISKESRSNLDFKTIVKAVATFGAAVGTVASGVKIANTYFASTGVGTPLAIVFNSAANGLATYSIGRTCGNIMQRENVELADLISGLFALVGASASDVDPNDVQDLMDNILKNPPSDAPDINDGLTP